MKGFVLGGTRSGDGKTVATLVTLEALAAAGYDPQPAKGGPDFIDPSHHAQVADRPSRTLDPWLQGESGLLRNYHRGDGDVCVVEGMMGLYDGSVTSTAAVAATLEVPVVLVVDASAGMESVAASALGFREYAAHTEQDVEVAGIIAQRAHGGRHEDGIREALPDDLEYVGRIPPIEELEIPDRHLGLHMGEESPVPESALAQAAEHVDGEALAAIAREPPQPDSQAPSAQVDTTVAVARDEAFCFTYPRTVELLRERAEVRTFSPVAGDPVPSCDGVYLPGGYPELHGEELAAGGTLSSLGERARDGLPVLGECGGFMALCRTLTTVDGETHEMAGVLPADVRMHERYQALDHLTLRAQTDTLTAASGESITAHEFHYSSASVDEGATFVFDVERGDGIEDGQDGLTREQTLGTYAHVHPETGAFDRFLERL